ncbi:hypothetical protein C8R44DRAFT_739423 [Mycena epipterygia]|nr:hypothetical protein C8R44DRAFT_739423 [Mycena epipterygia]
MSGLDAFLTSPARTRPHVNHRSSSPGNDFPDDQSDPNAPPVTPLNLAFPDISTALIGRKRPAEDMAQYTESAARHVRLKPDSKEELLRFAEASPVEQGIWLAARLLSQQERLDTLQPAESVYHIPTKLQGKLDKTAFLVIVDHTVPAYLVKDILVKRVQAHLEKHPSWGWTPEVKGDKSKTKVLVQRIRNKLTHSRNEIKSLLEKSIGEVNEAGVRTGHTNVYDLSRQIIALGSRVAPDAKVSLDLCVRVAFLRAKVQENPGSDFWTCVDTYLEKVRVSKNYQAERISEVFSFIYEADLLKFDGKLSAAELAALNEIRPDTFPDAD